MICFSGGMPLCTFALLILLALKAPAYSAEPRRLTDDGRLKFSPVFLGEGDEIAYSIHDVPNRLTLMRLKVADGSQIRMFPETEQHLLDPLMSRNGRYIVFARATTSPQLPLVIRDTRDNIESVYNPQEARAGVRSPSIAPDGSRVI